MPNITKFLANNSDGLYQVYIDGHPIGSPMTEEAANAKIKSLISKYNNNQHRDKIQEGPHL